LYCKRDCQRLCKGRRGIRKEVAGSQRSCCFELLLANKNLQQIHDISALIAWCGTDALGAIVEHTDSGTVSHVIAHIVELVIFRILGMTCYLLYNQRCSPSGMQRNLPTDNLFK